MTDIILVHINSRNITDYNKVNSMRFRLFPINFTYPNVGLAVLAAVLRQKGFSVRIIDSYLIFLTEKQTLDLILENKPKIIGINVSSPVLPEVFTFISRLKEKQLRYSLKSKIILGGPHITALPHSIFELGGDIGCIGEAEESLPAICDYFLNKKGDLSKVKGIIYKENGKEISTSIRSIDNLDIYPFAAYDLYLTNDNIKVQDYLRIIPLLSSRGCINKCTYCFTGGADDKRIKFRKPENVIEEMELIIRKYSPKLIDFCDECFSFDKQRLHQLIDLMQKRGIKVNWACETCVNFLDKKLLKRMFAAGCRKIRFGVETGSQRIRYSLNKRIDDKEYLYISQLCRRIGIETTLYLMLGFPGESREDMQQTRLITRKLDPDRISVQITMIFPRTKLYDQLIKTNKVKEDVWAEYMRRKKSYPYYIPKGFTFKDLEKIRLKIYLYFYFNVKVIIREIINTKSGVFPLKLYLRFFFHPRYSIQLFFRIVKGLRWKMISEKVKE